MQDGFLELKPNGSLLIRGSLENSTNLWQEALIFKTILNALRLRPLQTQNTLNDLNQKIYGDGVEHKFPPFLERVIQRIQTYFSVYKYTDTSKPVRVENKPSSITTNYGSIITTATTSSDLENETSMNFDNNEIDVNLTGITNSLNRLNKTTATTTTTTGTATMSSVNKFTKPLKTSTTTTTTPTTITTKTTIRPALIVIEGEDEADEENEFIEIKDRKKLLNENKSLEKK
ncbi:uncharacterized protein ACRADG_002368 isoform 2-T2 [Cochliomyia hominivorax]